jgi:hypothetical protein
MGFVFTFGVGALWGAKYFRPELFSTTEPFLIAFFLMYVTIPVAYALKGREPGKVDATLLFGTPLIAFPMQVALLDGETMPLAFSAHRELCRSSCMWVSTPRPRPALVRSRAEAESSDFSSSTQRLSVSKTSCSTPPQWAFLPAIQ